MGGGLSPRSVVEQIADVAPGTQRHVALVGGEQPGAGRGEGAERARQSLADLCAGREKDEDGEERPAEPPAGFRAG